MVTDGLCFVWHFIEFLSKFVEFSYS
ncbi:MAG: hypothetical protein H6R34_584, partial [Bacteroidetes bacterium]|nr:hypothetical protein [Bacteroidota bacterium]